MEYIAGQDLETLRQQQCGEPFSWSEVMTLMAPIIAAVIEMHRQQPAIIHGDIKPANIVMPSEDIRVVLVDFGALKACDQGTATAANKYRYRAPEQYTGSINVRTDIYALGATFYTLVTGKLPPDALSRLNEVGNGALDPLAPVNSVAPALPMRIGKAIERAMSLDAQHRFSSVEQFWEALWRLKEHPIAVSAFRSVQKGPQRAVGKASDILVPRPLPGVVLPDSGEERTPPDATIRLPRPPPGVVLPDSGEERTPPDAAIRLPKPPPGLPLPDSDEE
jgi:eukaryotic-like serine/threonine-protein kinase